MLSQSDILHGKILVVDDQEANVRLLEQMLRGAGYDAITSTMESDKVCELHLLNRYDLILLDLQMPGMDGFQVMENLKEIEQDGYLPVLVITAQPEHKLRALRAGAKDFVSKPFDLAEVLLRVHNMLEVRMLHLEARRLYVRIATEQKVSERRLLNGLPTHVAERLKVRLAGVADGASGLVGESYAEIAMLFADMVEFRPNPCHRRCLHSRRGAAWTGGGSYDPGCGHGPGPERSRGPFQCAQPLQTEDRHRPGSQAEDPGQAEQPLLSLGIVLKMDAHHFEWC